MKVFVYPINDRETEGFDIMTFENNKRLPISMTYYTEIMNRQDSKVCNDLAIALFRVHLL